ncbi:DUF3800 domain-containing protein [Megalodesulfovibrio paquesii]
MYIDESGDLGWKFDAPYKKGGSSRFFTVSAIVVSHDNAKYLGRLAKDMHRRKAWEKGTELKGHHLDMADRVHVANKLAGLARRGRIKLFATTIEKQFVRANIRDNQDVLYNITVKGMLLQLAMQHKQVALFPDNRSIKMKYANGLELYFKSCLAETDSETKLTCRFLESVSNKSVQVADYLAHLVWRRYEQQDRSAFDILYPHMTHHYPYSAGKAVASRQSCLNPLTLRRR